MIRICKKWKKRIEMAEIEKQIEELEA